MNKSVKETIKKSCFSLIVHSFCLLSLLSPVFLLSEVAHGEDSSVIGEKKIDQEEKQTDIGFTVEPVLPSTQVDESKSYYYIAVKPGEEQTLTLKVRSTMKDPRKVTIKVSDAFTNKDGVMDYDGTDVKRDETLVDSLEDISTVSEEEVTVEKLETKEVTITIKPPEQSFSGVKIAAICATSSESEEKQSGISSAFGYRLGLMITEDEEIDYADGSSLNLLQVKPTVHQGKRVIQARLQNPEPKILKKLKVETKLRRKGEQEVLRKRTTNDMRMAPNSQFDFATNWGLDPIEPGTYTLSVKADSGENTWAWEEEFTIGEEEAKKINEQATYTITYPTWVPIVVVLLGVVIIINIGSLYVRRKKWTTPK
ncbi:DUF916 and DUF3324 domain-containing protein [Enterococcus sp. 669A]|uniref:DUF916 and DUF3324 domain-containing protein n=1 Tax=Candidatus Enterococcus moelleringii TaxID=2815325 RepID=A0ABS3LB82_9ENTE|nr:DUF916 and DUF3324 domain-containing protein [Enterococcus sp. 669A]MBO1306895.1 DUF916 and DUF3324 domain-containing protein [Enterococcus sp. 669A]